MNLGRKQELFAYLHPRLIDHAHLRHWKVRLGELLRFQQQCDWNATHCRTCRKEENLIVHRQESGHRFVKIGIRNSVHRLKLAQDIILFEHGKPRWDADAYLELGEWWEQQHELCRWGGRFRDPGHFSLTHRGIR